MRNYDIHRGILNSNRNGVCIAIHNNMYRPRVVFKMLFSFLYYSNRETINVRRKRSIIIRTS